MTSASERLLFWLSIVRGQHSKVAVARDEAYTRSYRAIRKAVGIVGAILPVVLIIGEYFYLPGSVQVRGSLSAYYHTSMQDAFVGGLCVIGFLLATYLMGERRTVDFRVSLVAGLALLGVVVFPAARFDLPDGAVPCESGPSIAGCSWTEYMFGERPTAIVHLVMAVVFILCLAVMSLLFAGGDIEVTRSADGAAPTMRITKRTVFGIQLACAVAILLFGAWAFLGVQIWVLTPLYLGEIGAIWTFAASWFLAGNDHTAPNRSAAPADACPAVLKGGGVTP